MRGRPTQPRRAHWPVAVLVATAVIAAGCGSGTTKTVTVKQTPATTTPAAAATAVHIYALYSAEGKLTVPVMKTGSGSCFTGSIISQRSDAWRCSEGNKLLDPCFAAVLNAHAVLFPLEGPWSGQALELKHSLSPLLS